jgi:glycosyltransferase involved in cell wall biosynthesis
MSGVSIDARETTTARLEKPDFVVAIPQRWMMDDNARVLEREGRLRLLAMGTRRGAAGVSPEHTLLNPRIGLASYIAARLLPPFQAESLRYRLLPWFDHWVLKNLKPGDNIISSYAYANKCFDFVKQHGGKTFVDAGNSHVENFWNILNEEHRRWNCSYPPVALHWYQRARETLQKADFILSPSSYVTRSFLERGFKPEQILRNIYPVDLQVFRPSEVSRPKNRPLTVINTGSLSLRKGTPYLLEAFRLVLGSEPSARLLLTQSVREEVEPILKKNCDLPIEWSPGLPHAQLAERLRSADVFVLPSLEEGLVRTALEALACGLQVVLTPHCGANDFVAPGVNGEVVPIRDPGATAQAILKCWEKTRHGYKPPVGDLAQRLSFDTFAAEFLDQLRKIGVLSDSTKS